jgi:hypothetical protein
MAIYTIELEETHSQNAERLAAACKMPVSEVVAVCLRNRLEELAQQLEKAQGGKGIITEVSIGPGGLRIFKSVEVPELLPLGPRTKRK